MEHELAIDLLTAQIARLGLEAESFSGLAAADGRIERIYEDMAALRVSLNALREAQA